MWVANRFGRPFQHWVVREGDERALCGASLAAGMPVPTDWAKCPRCSATLEGGVPLAEAYPFASEPFKVDLQEAE